MSVKQSQNYTDAWNLVADLFTIVFSREDISVSRLDCDVAQQTLIVFF